MKNNSIFHQALKALCRALWAALCMAFVVGTVPASDEARAADIGVVVMHGKGGGPKGLVAPLAEYLGGQGFAVANLEMSWSKNKEYGESPEAGVHQIDAAFEKMKADGAKHLFVVGHSLGALFAAHYAAERPVKGLVLVAPGGNVASKFWQKKTADSLDMAERQIADGKGDVQGDYTDYEGAKGEFTIRVTADLYRAWFSKDSPLNQRRTYKRLPRDLPVLNVVPINDYKALVRQKDDLFDLLPQGNGTEMYEPNTDHRGAPHESGAKIADWIRSTATR